MRTGGRDEGRKDRETWEWMTRFFIRYLWCGDETVAFCNDML